MPDKAPNPESKKFVLIVEDDPSILRGLKDSFEFEGYRTRAAVDGRLALDLALELSPDLILLDIMLPGRNGFEICKHLRERGSKIPIIMLTAKNREEDIILGLNVGADDYVTKPFSIAELHARVRRLLARRGDDEPSAITFGPFVIEIAKRIVRKGREEPIALQPKEFDVLLFLARRPSRTFTRDQILDGVWDDERFVSDRSVDRCIRGLRKKVEQDSRHPRWIKTVHRIGYRFETE